MNDDELNRRELTGDDALRFAREAGLFYACVGDLIRFARLVLAGWEPSRVVKEPRTIEFTQQDGSTPVKGVALARSVVAAPNVEALAVEAGFERDEFGHLFIRDSDGVCSDELRKFAELLRTRGVLGREHGND